MAQAQQHDERKIWAMIEDQKIAMLSTWDGESLKSRPMATFSDEEAGVIWFYTRVPSGKTNEVQTYHKVNVAYADHDKSNYVSLSGWAEIVRDRAAIERFWNAFVSAWFPKGKDDPELVMLKFTPESGEYWDSPSSGLTVMWKTLKANMTGNTPDMGENRTVDMTH